MDQAAHDVADHVVQKGVPFEFKTPVTRQFRAAAGDVDAPQRLHRAEGLAGAGTKRCEIVFAQQVLRGCTHRGCVQRAKGPADAPRLQARAHG